MAKKFRHYRKHANQSRAAKPAETVNEVTSVAVAPSHSNQEIRGDLLKTMRLTLGLILLIVTLFYLNGQTNWIFDFGNQLYRSLHIG